MLFGFRTKIHKQADAALDGHLPGFEKALGAAQKNGVGYLFPTPAGPAGRLRLHYEERRKFLGGVFAMTLEATLPASSAMMDELRAAGPLRLGYKGAVLKGDAYFAAKGKTKESTLLDKLNADETLLKLLAEQDVERLDILAGDDGVRVKLSPVGGAYTYMVLPPLRYAVALPKGHDAKMAGTMRRIASIIGKIQ